MKRGIVLIFLLSVSILITKSQITVLNPIQQQHVEVAMRMIGHKVLWSVGDSASRVLPVERNIDTYQIRFASEFAMNPDAVSAVVDSVMAETAISTDYIVEIRSCETNAVIHGYEVSSEASGDIQACRGRDIPEGCYTLNITILNYILPFRTVDNDATTHPDLVGSESYSEVIRLLGILGLVVLALIGVIAFLRKRNATAEDSSHIVQIGNYKFNKRAMELWFNDEKIELTSKECDLLQLLCDSTNDTVERETILKMVWGDEGDYVGRTLDVFISKLRKKLEADDRVRIVNIRGIGYKLVLDT